MQLVLGAGARQQSTITGRSTSTEPTRLLRRLQAACAPTAARRRRRPAPDDDAPCRSTAADRSLQVHACHGRGRQVEVVRDAILHLLADDPTLEPRDVIVMCPDIEAFAPLIHATFGAGGGVDDEDDERRRRTAHPTSGSGSPTGRCARPTPSSAPSPRCSTWPTPG